MSTTLLQPTAPASRLRRRSVAWVPWVVGLSVGAIHALIACLRYANFDVSSWDLAIFTQAINNYAHFHAPIANVHGIGFNVLGDHFSPVLALLPPPCWIWKAANRRNSAARCPRRAAPPRRR